MCPGGVGPWGPFSILRGSYEALSKTGRVRGRCVVGVIIIIIALFYLFFSSPLSGCVPCAWLNYWGKI